jgi:hypothetical protein
VGGGGGRGRGGEGRKRGEQGKGWGGGIMPRAKVPGSTELVMKLGGKKLGRLYMFTDDLKLWSLGPSSFMAPTTKTFIGSPCTFYMRPSIVEHSSILM